MSFRGVRIAWNKRIQKKDTDPRAMAPDRRADGQNQAEPQTPPNATRESCRAAPHVLWHDQTSMTCALSSRDPGQPPARLPTKQDQDPSWAGRRLFSCLCRISISGPSAPGTLCPVACFSSPSCVRACERPLLLAVSSLESEALLS
jgi:hypothetical protein